MQEGFRHWPKTALRAEAKDTRGQAQPVRVFSVEGVDKAGHAFPAGKNLPRGL